jgi:hypothetical protein
MIGAGRHDGRWRPSHPEASHNTAVTPTMRTIPGGPMCRVAMPAYFSQV